MGRALSWMEVLRLVKKSQAHCSLKRITWFPLESLARRAPVGRRTPWTKPSVGADSSSPSARQRG